MPLRHVPCVPGAHIGEQIAREYLYQQLPDSEGVLISNYHQPIHNGTEEHDLILVNERGVWAIEVKHWYGRIDADEVSWFHSGHKKPSPVVKVEGKARNLAATLREAGLNNISVVGIVVLTRPEAKFRHHPPKEHARKVFRLDERLVQAVTGTEYLFREHNRTLDKKLIDRVTDVVVTRSVDPDRRILGNYRLLHEFDPYGQEPFVVYEAEHLRFPELHVRVKQYRISNFQNEDQLATATARYEQTMRALLQLEHPNIIREVDFMVDPDNDAVLWLLLEWFDGQLLLNILESNQQVPYAEQVRIITAVVSALSECHGKGIVHRHLTPTGIGIGHDGTVRIGNFEYAYVPRQQDDLPMLGELPPGKDFLAPEVRDGSSLHDPRSDLYSLGAIWLAMALPLDPEAEEPLDRSRVDNVNLPPPARDLLARLLHPDPAQRPTSAAAVLAELERLPPA